MSQPKFLPKLAIVGMASLIGVIGNQDLKAVATPFVAGPKVPGCSPLLGNTDCRRPVPPEVAGKEYSNHIDVDDTQPIPLLDPEQNLAWDGTGGRSDTFDYSRSRVLNFGDGQDREVDALANIGDFLFNDVVADTVWLLFSTDEDNRIFYEDPTTPTGGIWATPPEIDIDMATLDPDAGIQGITPTDMDVDGLEVWGGDGPSLDDANQYSLEFDSVVDPANGRRVSVFNYFGGVSSSHFYADELATAICGLKACTSLDQLELTETLDVDATMVSGEEIMWSVDPFTSSGGLVLDGGEIFVWDKAIGGAATYLMHGGHMWDTDFEVMATFGTATENINALEAVAVVEDGVCQPDPNIPQPECGVSVPEPGTVMGLLAISGLGFGLKRKKQDSI